MARTKIRWFSDNVAGVRKRARSAELAYAFAGRRIIARAADRAGLGALHRQAGALGLDGSAAANDLLTRQADATRVSVERPNGLEFTARGAAMLAGVGARSLASGAHSKKMLRIERTLEVRMEAAERERRLMARQDAVPRARS